MATSVGLKVAITTSWGLYGKIIPHDILVYNLLLENSKNFLLENGGLILLE